MFSGAISEKNLQRLGKIYKPKRLQTKSRKDLIASLNPKVWQYFRADNGDLPEHYRLRSPALATGACNETVRERSNAESVG